MEATEAETACRSGELAAKKKTEGNLKSSPCPLTSVTGTHISGAAKSNAAKNTDATSQSLVNHGSRGSGRAQTEGVANMTGK